MRRWLGPLLLCVVGLLAGCNSRDVAFRDPVADKLRQVWVQAKAQKICPLTGAALVEQGTPMMVVIDNHPAARPQHGLGQADIIYEVPVEGGLTRFLALYTRAPASSSNRVGPIRSVRGYFAFLAAEYGACIVHHGQSVSYLAMGQKLSVHNLDLLDPKTQPVWRDLERPAPHNLYSNVPCLLACRDNLPAEYSGRTWLFSNKLRPLSSIGTITLIHPGGYSVEYRLHKDGAYERFTEGKKHDFTVDNVIVQMATVKDGNEVSVELVGRGIAYFFTRGQVYSGIWVKEAVTDPTRFYDNNGALWELTGGRTIIHVVPTLTSVMFR